MDADRCIFCGEIIPEGRWVCPVCEKKYTPDDSFSNIQKAKKKTILSFINKFFIQKAYKTRRKI